MSETRRRTRGRPDYKPDDLLTRHETAAYLDISLSRLAQHRRAGKIGQEKNAVTRAVRFRFSEVEKLRRWREDQVVA